MCKITKLYLFNKSKAFKVFDLKSVLRSAVAPGIFSTCISIALAIPFITGDAATQAPLKPNLSLKLFTYL